MTMCALSSSTARKFTSWCCLLALVADVFFQPSTSTSTSTSTHYGGSVFVSAFTTPSSLGGNNSNNHRSRRRLRSDNDNGNDNDNDNDSSTSTRTSSQLQLSFSPMELPVVNELVSTYGYCLKHHYFPTQSMTNAVLTVVGDGIAQTEEARKQQQQQTDTNSNNMNMNMNNNMNTNINMNDYYDPKRGLVYFFKGLGSGVLWASWFDHAEVWSTELTQSVLSHGSIHNGNGIFQEPLSAATTMVSLQSRTIRTMINISLEQFLVCPIVFSLWDIPVTAVMRGTTIEQVPAQIQEKLKPLLLANAKAWTLVNIVTYNIPLEYRLLFTSAASIVWESISSGITSKQIEEEPTTVQVQVQQ